MKVSELIEALKGHEDKRVGVAFLADDKGKPTLATGPFSVVTTGDCDISFIPAVFMEQEPVRAKGLTKDMLEKLVPKKHLKPRYNDPSRHTISHMCHLEKISKDAKACAEYLIQEGIMSEIDQRSGQKNEALYFAYAIQAYYQGVLK